MNTAQLWPLTSGVLVLQSILLYFTWAVNPFTVFLIPSYWFIAWDMRRQADYIKYIIPLLIVNVIMDIVFMIHPVFLVSTILLGMVFGLNLKIIGKELKYFNRTVLSMNGLDRQKAKIALKTGKPEDIAKVAVYTDWNSISR